MSKLHKSDWIDDWYVVDGPWASIEGTVQEWRPIIAAMKERKSLRAGSRVAVTFYDDGRFKLFSPRNCSGPDDVVRFQPEELGGWIEQAEIVLNANA